MTSASELFFTTRRSGVRSTRTPLSSHEFSVFDSDSSTSSSPEHILQNRRRRRRIHQNRHDRPPLLRHLAEHGTVRFEQSASETQSISSRPGHDRLPGNVLLARERLLERLRGTSISENRQSSRVFSGDSLVDDMSTNDFRLVDARNRGPETSGILPTAGHRSLEVPPQTDRSQLPRKSNKPSGLTQEDINSLHVKVFSKKEDINGEASVDCSICLENYLVGDKLINLPCGHKFHSACLSPWIRICGDCPNCRRDITV